MPSNPQYQYHQLQATIRPQHGTPHLVFFWLEKKRRRTLCRRRQLTRRLGGRIATVSWSARVACFLPESRFAPYIYRRRIIIARLPVLSFSCFLFSPFLFAAERLVIFSSALRALSDCHYFALFRKQCCAVNVTVSKSASAWLDETLVRACCPLTPALVKRLLPVKFSCGCRLRHMNLRMFFGCLDEVLLLQALCCR